MKKLTAAIIWCSALVIGTQGQVPCSPLRVTALEQTRVITDLRASDLTLKVRGNPVPITSAVVKPGRRFVLLIDSSGSMSGSSDIKSDRKNWLLSLDLAKQIVAAAPENYSIALITFADAVKLRVPLTEKRDALHDAIETERRDVRAPYGKTPLWDALHEAFGMLGLPQDGDFLVPITDGGNNNSKIDALKLQSELSAYRIRVFPIISAEDPRTDEERQGLSDLHYLADNSGGAALSLNPWVWAKRDAAEKTEFLASVANSTLALATYSFALQIETPNFEKRAKLHLEIARERRDRKKVKLLYQPAIGPCRNDKLKPDAP